MLSKLHNVERILPVEGRLCVYNVLKDKMSVKEAVLKIFMKSMFVFLSLQDL